MNDTVQPSNALSGALGFVEDYRYVLFYMIGFGAAPLLLDFLFAIGPPWPQASGVAAFTSIATWLVLLYCYVTWNDLRKRSFQHLMRVLAPTAFICLVLYIALVALFVYDAPDYRNREAVGFWLRPDVQNVLDTVPGQSIEKLFEGAEYQPTMIWAGWTVRVNRALLLSLWLVLFGLVSLVCSVFVLSQYERERTERAKKRRKRRGIGGTANTEVLHETK